ncbi:hypothetical protein L484_024458 [Morus notabilis]|uniref:Uncharacterized protein n=1 Tax=Morus notabilis TaxID=981085 RepID=W9S7Y5_9ROSA|nr:hypothetical protein L484_024458 [Morus notabilis]
MAEESTRSPVRLMNFVSEEQLDEAKRRKGERVKDGTAQRDRPLYEYALFDHWSASSSAAAPAPKLGSHFVSVSLAFGICSDLRLGFGRFVERLTQERAKARLGHALLGHWSASSSAAVPAPQVHSHSFCGEIFLEDLGQL